jgi:hypothetical protein
MTFARYDPYRPVHKAMRRQIVETSCLLASTDFDHEGDREGSFAALEETIATQRDHAGHENRHVHPALEERRPGATSQADATHKKIERILEKIEAQAEALRSGREDDMPLAGHRLYLAFNEFVAEYLAHLNYEEKQINPILWELFTDEELGEIETRIVADTPPELVAVLTPLLLRSLNARELIDWLQGIRQEAPPAAFDEVLAQAKQLVPPDRWLRVSTALELE